MKVPEKFDVWYNEKRGWWVAQLNDSDSPATGVGKTKEEAIANCQKDIEQIKEAGWPKKSTPISE